MKKFQAPNAHRVGVSHIYFAQVLAKKMQKLEEKKILFICPSLTPGI
jgi:hypothetical protein